MTKLSHRAQGLTFVRRQRGATAIEFALLFSIFLALFYAIVTYALLFLLQASFAHAATEGARAAIAVDPLRYENRAAYISEGVSPRVRAVVGDALRWLPARARDRVLGVDNAKVEIITTSNGINVVVRYRNYMSDPLIPLISIPGIGPIYSNSNDLVGQARISLS